jgi:ribosomal protein L7/L12
MDQATINRLNALAGAIARLEKKVDFILAELKLEYPEDDGYPPELTMVVALLKDGKLAAAIQAYMGATGAGMGDAKAAVEKMDMEIKSGGG